MRGNFGGGGGGPLVSGKALKSDQDENLFIFLFYS